MAAVYQARTRRAPASTVAASASRWKPKTSFTRPELNAAAAPHRLSVRSPVPCTSTRDRSGTDAVRIVVPADQTEAPPEPEEEQPCEHQHRHVAGQHRADRAHAEDDRTDLDRTDRSHAVDESTDDRRQAVHPDDVQCDHERRQIGVTVILHVRRRHRHHADHRRLRRRHRREAEPCARRRPDHRRRRPHDPQQSRRVRRADRCRRSPRADRVGDAPTRPIAATRKNSAAKRNGPTSSSRPSCRPPPSRTA